MFHGKLPACSITFRINLRSGVVIATCIGVATYAIRTLPSSFVVNATSSSNVKLDLLYVYFHDYLSYQYEMVISDLSTLRLALKS